jgi:tetratricopeptide (TPR) repeat protein
MLVVRVSKFLIGKPCELQDIRPFLESLGYKRLLVIRDAAFFPIPVLLDETMDDPDLEKKEQIKSSQQSVAASAAVSNADLNAMRTELKIDQDRWIQNEAEQLPNWWRQSILKKVRQLEKEGHCEEALNDLLRVAKVCPDPDVNLHLALCYAHLHRRSDALALMNKLPDCIWTIKAEIYNELGMYEEALAACNEPTMIFNEPVLYKAKLLLAHNDREAAFDTARKQYWHTARLDVENDELENFLKQFDVVLTPPPENRTCNQPVIAFLKRLPKLQPPTKVNQLEQIFERKFVINSKDARNENQKYLNAEALREGDNKFSYVRLTHQVYDPSIILNVDIGTDFSFITVDEVRKILHSEHISSIIEQTVVPGIAEHGNARPRGGGAQLNCAFKGGQLQFVFRQNGQLSAVEKKWDKNPAEQEEYRLATIPTEFHETDLELVEHNVTAGDFRDSALQLLSYWDSVDPTKTDRADILKLRRRKRDLLVRCFIGMNRSDIADYLKAAPLIHISELAGGYRYLPLEKVFPSYDEYMRTKWKVDGNSSQPDGGYSIWFGRSITVYHDSPMFSKFYALLGPLLANRELKVPPLPGALIDEFLFESGQ